MRRPFARLILSAAVGAGVTLGSAEDALAYFSTTATGTVHATTATINPPSNVTVAASGTTVTITWAAASLSTGGAVQGYRVTRSDSAPVCGTPALVTSLSCTDSSVPAGTYTYTVTAVYQSWTASGTSSSIGVLSAPTITSMPANPSASGSASFSFSGGRASSYQCQLDGGSFSSCASPNSHTGLADGSHTFKVHGVQGSSTGPDATYTWLVDTIRPTQAIALVPGASNAFLSGSMLYYNGTTGGGSFKLVDTVSDTGSGPASARFASIATTGWTHAAETVTTPSGGPYTSGAFTWSANPTNPTSYSVTGADAAGNTTTPTAFTFVSDTIAPTGGALGVNATAASAAGSTSVATNSTSFAIGSRTDYVDSGSGLQSSVLTVQSESLSGTTCGAAGSGGPFTSPTTITGTAQPSGIVAGFCYLYRLTGTDNVGNVASISTTVEDDALSFAITTQPSTVTAGTATAPGAVVLTAIKNGATDSSLNSGSATLTWGGAGTSPTGATPTLPATATWSSGTLTFGITLVEAETETLSVTDGTRRGTFTPITVNAGAAARLAWTSVSSSVTLPSPCFFACTYSSGFGSSHTWTANVSITDGLGNTVSNIGTGHAVVVTLGGSLKGSTTPASPATLTIPSSGAAQSTTPLQYTSESSNGNYTDTLTATSAGYTNAAASFSR